MIEKYDKKLISEDILKQSEGVFSAASKLYTDLDEERPYRIKEEILGLLKKVENLYLRSKDLSVFLRDKEVPAEDLEAPQLGMLTKFSDKAFLFTLPPMRSVRKTEEGIGLGKVIKAEVISLIEEERGKGMSVPTLKNPVLHFVHHISKESVKNGLLFDADNLDTSKVIDGLQTAQLIGNDTVISITLVHEGCITDTDETLLYVYEKGAQSDIKC